MRKLKCNEVGFKDCNWELLGKTDEEVIRKAREHDKQLHNVDDIDEAKLRGHIRSA